MGAGPVVVGAGPVFVGAGFSRPMNLVSDTDPDYPFRSGPSCLAGLVVFVVVNVFVYAVTGEVGKALAIGFALWVVAVVITRLFARGRND